MFKQVIVLEVFSDTQIYTEENMRDLMNYYGVKSSKIINKLPPNTIIAVDACTAGNISSNEAKIYLPMLSHVQLPIKPGEWAWVLEINGAEDNSYWLSRIVGLEISNDVNFTHNDKKFLDLNNKDYPGNLLINGMYVISDKEEPTDNFKTLKLNPDVPKKSENEYEFIIKNSISKNFIQNEPIPKISSRPDEHLIQGSNNSYILLGTDRTENKPISQKINIKNFFKESKKRYSLTGDINFLADTNVISNSDIITFKNEKKESIGCVDIVAGKKDKLMQSIPLISEEQKVSLWNERDKKINAIEDKLKYFNNIDQPNFSEDSSRVYITQKTNLSTNFGLSWAPNQNISESLPAIVLKSDNVKLIGRKDIGIIFQPKIESSKDDCSYVVLNNNVSIKAPGKISIGNGTDELLKNVYSLIKIIIDNATSLTLSSIGPTSLNPIVLTELNKILSSLMKITNI